MRYSCVVIYYRLEATHVCVPAWPSYILPFKTAYVLIVLLVVLAVLGLPSRLL